MTEPPQPLSDDEVHGRLVAAVEALGDRPAATVRGDTALMAARRALTLFQLGLLMAVEKGSDDLPGYRPPDA